MGLMNPRVQDEVVKQLQRRELELNFQDEVARRLQRSVLELTYSLEDEAVRQRPLAWKCVQWSKLTQSGPGSPAETDVCPLSVILVSVI